MSSKATFSTILKDDVFAEEEETDAQTGGNWRDLIFLPFNISWKIFVVLTVVCNIFLVLYNTVFTDMTWPITSQIPYYLFEMVYFTYTLLLGMHRCMKTYQKTRHYSPTHVFLLIIDTATLIPYYEMYYLLHRSSEGAGFEFAVDYPKIKVLGRLHTVVIFLVQTRNRTGMNQVAILFVMHMMQILFYTLFVACFWYLIKDIFEINWQRNLVFHKFDRESSFDWFLICMSAIGNTFAHNWKGVVDPENHWEYLIFAVTMIIGFVSHTMILFGNLTTQYIKKIMYQFDFSSRVNLIMQLLDDWQVDEIVKKRTMQFYNKYWERRNGIVKMPDLFRSLPVSLKKDVCVDVFWDMFRHSHFLGDLDMNFKRSLSPLMECQFYLPGDSLLLTDDFKTKTMYIVSGVVQILSQDDQLSPVMSFSSGTVFSEVASLICIGSKVSLRCATYCEIYSLDLRCLCKVMAKYPGMSSKLHTKLAHRIKTARMMQNKTLLWLKDKSQKRTSILWIKKQWWNTLTCTQSAKKAEKNKQQVMPFHLSDYLDLYVLSDEFELKMKAICLKSKCPYIMDPSSSFRKFCEHVIIVAVLLQTLYVPYIVFFVGKMSLSSSGILYILDMFYLFGLYLDVSTAIKHKNHMITGIVDILVYKGKRISTIVNIIATLPLELITYALVDDSNLLIIVHINRCLKIYNLYAWIDSLELNVWLDILRIRVLKYTAAFLYLIYFTSCLMYGLACYGSCNETRWLSYNKHLEVKYENFTMEEEKTPSVFMLSLTYSMSILLNLTNVDYHAYSIIDVIAEYVLTLLGYYVISFCFAELAACSVLQLKDKVNYQKYLEDLKEFVKQNEIPSDLVQSMYETLQCRWNYCQGLDITGPNSLLKDAPQSVKNTVVLNRIVKHLRNVPMFSECDDSLLWNVASFADLLILPPGALLMREQTWPCNFYLVLRGYCKVESSVPTDKYHRCVTVESVGYLFPVPELLHNINSFLNVTAVTFMEVACISYSSTLIQLRGSTEYFRDLTIVLEDHIKTYDTILKRRKGRLPEMAVNKSYGKGEYFTYETNEGFDSDPAKLRYLEPFRKLGRWRFLRYLLLRQTLNPTKMIYLTWECIRCSVACLNVLYVLLFVSHALRLGVNEYFNVYFTVVGIVDFYMKMHCQYYDERGIFISHPLYTAKHYISTSFLLDLYCIFPYSLLNVHNMFSGYNAFRAYITLSLLMRSVLLWRVYCGLTYLQEKSKKGRATLIQKIKYGILIVVTIGVLASFTELFTCSYDVNLQNYECSKDTWVGRSLFGKTVTEYNIIYVCYYQIFTIFATSCIGLFSVRTYNECIFFSFVICVLFITRWIILAKITSYDISGNTTLILYRHNVNVFLKFMCKNNVDNELIKEALEHYDNYWKRTKGYRTKDILSTLPPVLQADFYDYLFLNCMHLVEIFRGTDYSTLRYFCKHFEVLHFKKDADIIRCNDVQDYLFIVYKGCVEISIAKTKLCTLTPGGVFGCLYYDKIRQTILAKTQIHVDILAIKSGLFHRLIANHPKIKTKVRNAIFLRSEYFPSISSSWADSHGVLHAGSFTAWNKNLLINSHSKWYKIYSYVMNMHVATLSTLIVMVMIVKVGSFTFGSYHYVMYFFDVLYLVKIFFGFHLTYVDYESGLLVTSQSKISWRYITSINGFCLDLFTCIPFELFGSLITSNFLVYRYCWSNRVFRIFVMIGYYFTCKNQITISKTLKWTYLIYIMAFLIHLMWCIWWLVACPNEHCTYWRIFEKSNHKFTTTETSMSAFQVSYLYVINIFTSTGLRDQTPTNMNELVTSVAMIFVSQFTVLALTAGFASMLVLGKCVMGLYENKIKLIKHYMKVTDVSAVLVDKVSQYLGEMWNRNSGSWIPKLLQRAPPYMKQDIMYGIYGKHFDNHVLFKKTHVDFIRQVVVHLQLYTFFPGEYVVQAGDIDGTMYFIHEGEVTVYGKTGNNECEQGILQSGDSFGESQGLNYIEHVRSYKANTVSVILALKKRDWQYLLPSFPASREEILSWREIIYQSQPRSFDLF